jgi:ornithine cyclodeaminase
MPDEIPWIGSTDLRRGFGMAGAIAALEDFLVAGATASAPQRHVVPFGQGQMITMPAIGAGGAGVKLVTIQPANPVRSLPLIHSVYVLIDPDTLAPQALVDGTELTRLRTAAVSAVATRVLAREEASRLVVFGAGVQAEAHVAAIREVRPIAEVRIVGRSDSADHLVARLSAGGGLAVSRAAASAVGDADVICTCTSATEPLFAAADLPAGVHINAIGAFEPDAREVDTQTVATAAVFVDDREAALAEAGDLRIPIEAGEFDPDRIAGDLRAIVNRGAGRRSAREITLFKSVGVAWEDLAVAGAAWAALRPQG